jgi:hypothetical protein
MRSIRLSLAKRAFDCPADTTYNPYDTGFVRNRPPGEDRPSRRYGPDIQEPQVFASNDVSFGTLSGFSIPVEM